MILYEEIIEKTITDINAMKKEILNEEEILHKDTQEITQNN